MYVMFNSNISKYLLLALFLSVVAVFSGSLSAASVLRSSDFKTLQAALDACPEDGGALFITPGNHVITEPLVVAKANLHIFGVGTATAISNANTHGKPGLIIRNPDYPTNRKARIWRVNLSRFRVTGSTNSGDGILAQGVQEILLDGMTVDHNGGHGVYLDHCYENPRINNCMITYNGRSGIQLDGCHDIVVNGNQFEENWDALRCHDGFNLTMNGNNLDDHLRHGVVIENTYGSVLSGNMIEECNGTAVILDRDVYGITVSANVLAHNMSGGIYALDAHGCAFSANTFTLLHTNSIYISPASGRLTITGNNFCNSYTGNAEIRRKTDRMKEKRPIQWDIGTGIHVDNASNIVISGNLFSGLDKQAIRTGEKSQGIVMSGNLFADVNRHNPGEKSPVDVPRSTTSGNHPAPKP